MASVPVHEIAGPTNEFPIAVLGYTHGREGSVHAFRKFVHYENHVATMAEAEIDAERFAGVSRNPVAISLVVAVPANVEDGRSSALVTAAGLLGLPDDASADEILSKIEVEKIYGDTSVSHWRAYKIVSRGRSEESRLRPGYGDPAGPRSVFNVQRDTWSTYVDDDRIELGVWAGMTIVLERDAEPEEWTAFLRSLREQVERTLEEAARRG